MIRLLALCCLGFLIAACDSEAPDDGSTVDPDAVVVVTVLDADGEPVEGLDVFATYGALLPVTPTRAPLDPISAAPTPARTFTTLRFEVDANARLTVRLFDVADEPLATVFDEAVPAGPYAVTVDLGPYPAGAYRAEVSAGSETQSRWLLKTDAADDGIVGLAVSLGRTDAEGQLVVTDRTRFPGLYDEVPSPYVVTDETGQQLGQFSLNRAVGITVQGSFGSQGTTVLLGAEPADARITLRR